MKKLSPLKKCFALLVIPTILLFLWTKDLHQNNKEYLFLNKDLKSSYDNYVKTFGHDDQLILAIPREQADQNETTIKKISAITTLLEQHNISTWTTPLDTTKKQLPSEWIKFYESHPNMDFKLSTAESDFLIIQVPELNDKEQLALYNSLSALPFPIHMAGMGFTNHHLNLMGESIQTKLFPLLFLLTLLASFYYYRNWEITLFVFINSLFATMLGLAILKVYFGEANILTTSVPLINFVTTQSLSIHLISGLFTYKGIGLTYKRKLTPMILMVSSTIVGFFSLITSDIIAVKQFAISSSLTLLITTIFYLVLWKLVLKNLEFPRLAMKPLQMFYSPKLITRPIVYIFSILCLGLAFYSYPKLTTTVEALYFFPDDHPLITSFKKIEERLGGTPKLEIIFSKKDHSSFEYADEASMVVLEETLLNKLKTEFPQLKLVSRANLVKNANYAYTGNKIIPDNQIAYNVMFSQVPQTLKSGYEDTTHFRLTLLNPTLPTVDYMKMIETLKQALNQGASKYDYNFNGLNYTLMISQQNLVHSLLVSLGLSMALVCLMVILVFRKPKKLINFIIVNTPPLTLTIALLYFSGTALNISTVKTFSISFGMIFDSTIHLLYNYNRANMDPYIFQQAVLNPIYLSSFVTIVSFLMFGFHSFLPIKEFGLLLGLLLALGLLFDVLLLPVLERAKK